MNRNVLREFLHRSREWSRVTRGMELFEMSAADLQLFADADTGFFVYRKRILTHGVTPQTPSVYVPWGAFANDTDKLQALIDKVIPNMDMLTPMMEKWVLAEDMPQPFQEQWRDYGLLELGIWPLITREVINGAIVVARTHRASDRLTLSTRLALLDTCAAQVSLALDLILAMRIAEESSQRDLLTGLLNRRGFESRLSEMIETTHTDGLYLSFGLIDLDDLKQINDTAGHPAGDAALRQIADIIRRFLGPDNLVARLGGDEFAVLFVSSDPDADRQMQNIQQAIYVESDGYSASVGGALWGIDGDTIEECYRIADERLYQCKRQRKINGLK